MEDIADDEASKDAADDSMVKMDIAEDEASKEISDDSMLFRPQKMSEKILQPKLPPNPFEGVKSFYMQQPEPKEFTPATKEEIKQAKAFLSIPSPVSNMTLYDHLGAVLSKIIRLKVENAVDIIEDISHEVKLEMCSVKPLFIEKSINNENLLAAANILRRLYESVVEDKGDVVTEERPPDEDEEEPLEEEDINLEEEEEIKSESMLGNLEDRVPDLCYHMYHFERAGVGLKSEEAFHVTLAIKALAKGCKLDKVRFWGKIIGLKKNYYVAETKYRKGIEKDILEYEAATVVIERRKTEELTTERRATETNIKEDHGYEEDETLKEEEALEEEETLIKETIKEEETLNEEVTLNEEESLKEEEIQNELADEEEARKLAEDAAIRTEQLLSEFTDYRKRQTEPREKPPLPEIQYKPPPAIPIEENGTGANKYIYFVCTQPGLPWRCLPQVTPAQIIYARLIKRFFIGNLNAEVSAYPRFPGKEAHYLRAQIARITASTMIAPKDYYYAAETEEPKVEEEEKGEENVSADEIDESSTTKLPEFQENIVENPNYQAITVKEMLAQKLEGWVHQREAITLQGRCVWIDSIKEEQMEETEEDEELLVEVQTENVSDKGKEEDEDEKENEEEEKDAEKDAEEEKEDAKLVKEKSVPLLRCLSLDEGAGGVIPWFTSISSRLLVEFAVVLVRSNVWPGSYAYYDGKMFENIYVGFAHKYTARHYAPPHPLTKEVIQMVEYPIGPEITEPKDMIPHIIEDPFRRHTIWWSQKIEDAEDDVSTLVVTMPFTLVPIGSPSDNGDSDLTSELTKEVS